jgi:antitoxin (DNA-binding transcriptional repressor) of toxin-antitoxin stability system
MKTFSVREARTNLSKLLALIEQGEIIVIARNGRPIARLSAISNRRPKPGFEKGRIWMAGDCFRPLSARASAPWDGD